MVSYQVKLNTSANIPYSTKAGQLEQRQIKLAETAVHQRQAEVQVQIQTKMEPDPRRHTPEYSNNDVYSCIDWRTHACLRRYPILLPAQAYKKKYHPKEKDRAYALSFLISILG